LSNKIFWLIIFDSNRLFSKLLKGRVYTQFLLNKLVKASRLLCNSLHSL